MRTRSKEELQEAAAIMATVWGGYDKLPKPGAVEDNMKWFTQGCLLTLEWAMGVSGGFGEVLEMTRASIEAQRAA